MKAFTLVSIVMSAMAFSSCCCQSQPMPGLRPMPKDLTSDTPVVVEQVKVIDFKGK